MFPHAGIDVLLKAYLEFRQKLEESESPPLDNGPQLIIMGHGSIDDPDGSWVYEKLHDTLNSPGYELIHGDVAIVRAPPSDAILGCILQGAWVATQLSTRYAPCLQFMMFLLIFVPPRSEGFEVKVTEAINKRVPIIASDAGGIPLQVKEGKNGWIVPAGDSAAVSDTLYKIHKGELSVHRDISVEEELDGKSDPNSVAQEWVSVSTLPFIILLPK